MDYKQIGNRHGFGSPYEHFGNFNYGAVGSALGIPSQVLLRMAGLAQILADTSPAASGNPLGRAPYGDTALDQAWAQAGIDYYRCLAGD